MAIKFNVTKNKNWNENENENLAKSSTFLYPSSSGHYIQCKGAVGIGVLEGYTTLS